MLSLIGVPLGVVTPNTTDSAPLSRLTCASVAAISSSASSQLMRFQPGSAAPFGALRRIGYNTRLGLCTSSGAALPFMHIALPVGCVLSGRTFSSVSPRTVLIVPHLDRHNVQ